MNSTFSLSIQSDSGIFLFQKFSKWNTVIYCNRFLSVRKTGEELKKKTFFYQKEKRKIKNILQEYIATVQKKNVQKSESFTVSVTIMSV